MLPATKRDDSDRSIEDKQRVTMLGVIQTGDRPLVPDALVAGSVARRNKIWPKHGKVHQARLVPRRALQGAKQGTCALVEESHIAVKAGCED